MIAKGHDFPGVTLVGVISADETLNPDHYAISRAAAHDFAGFYSQELEFRREAGYPPFAHLAALTLSGNGAEAVDQGAETVAALLLRLKKELRSRVEVLGPVVAPLGKIRGRYRR